VANYTHGIGLVSRVNGNNSNYYDADAIGSTVGLTATDGSYVNKYSYLPFGEDLTKVEAVANPFEYVGQWGVTDEGNGLDFMRARFYDNSLGRFTSVDPINLAGGDTNFYRYVGNSPASFVDPSGLIRLIPTKSFAKEFAKEFVRDTVIEQMFDGAFNLDNKGLERILESGFSGGLEGASAAFAVAGPYAAAAGFVTGAAAGLILQGFLETQGKGGKIDQFWEDLLNKAWNEAKDLFPDPSNGPGGTGGDKDNDGIPDDRDTDNDNDGIPDDQDTDDDNDGIPDDQDPDKDNDGNPDNPNTPNPNKGGTYNDPHLNTLDGLGYDFQAVGEFTLVKSTTDDFEIQTRQQPWGSSTSASANTAISIKSGGQRIALYANQTNPLLINGTAVTLPEGGLYAVGQNLITREGSKYSIITANNDLILVSNRGTFLNIWTSPV